MQGPLRPVPAVIARWTAAARLLRWLDALLAWVVLWGAARVLLDTSRDAAVAAFVVVALGCLVRPLRARWRPLTGAVGLFLTSRLAPGDHAWYVGPGMLAEWGMLGRSEGCFAVNQSDLPKVLDRLGPGHLLIATKL